MRLFLHFLGVIFVVLPAHAEQEPQILSAMVVEELRGSVLPKHFAGSATVIDRESITQSGVRSLSDLLTSLGGVRVTNSSGNPTDGEVHLRGFGENSSSRVLILINGRPLNRPDMGAISLLEIPLARVRKIEILRGSQSARFGDNAVGGVINLITNPDDNPETSVELAVGSQNFTLARLSHHDRYFGSSISLDAERNFSDGWRDNSASETQSASIQWQRKMAYGTDFQIGFSLVDQLNEFPGPLSKGDYLQNPRQSIYQLAGQGNQYFSEQTTQRIETQLTLPIGTRFTFDAPVNASNRALSWNLGPGSHTDTDLVLWTFTPTLRWESDTTRFELGLNARTDELELDSFAEISRINRISDASLDRQLFGLFSSAEWEFREKWHLNASARLEHSAVDAAARSFTFPADPLLNFSRSNDETNPAFQLGIRGEILTSFDAWFRYDRLYRLPSTDEIAAYQGFPLSQPFNDQLVAETGDNFELGAEYGTADGWNCRMNGFLQQLQGEIIYDFVQNLNVNFAKTRRIGLETEVRYQAKMWDASLRYTRIDAKFQEGPYDGNSIYLVPNHEVSALVSTRPTANTTLQGEYQFTGSAHEGNDFLNQAEKLPSFGVFNLLLRYEPKPKLSLYFRINNLFDESYAALKYSGVWFPAAGRTFQCGLRQEF